MYLTLPVTREQDGIETTYTVEVRPRRGHGPDIVLPLDWPFNHRPDGSFDGLTDDEIDKATALANQMLQDEREQELMEARRIEMARRGSFD